MTHDIRFTPLPAVPHEPTPELQLVPNPNGDGALAAVKDGWTVSELEGPRRNQRLHVFDDLPSCAAWLNRHAVDRAAAEILVAEREIVAALTPTARDNDLVKCKLTYDTRFAAWHAAFASKQISQKQFHALLRAQAQDLSEDVFDVMVAAVRDLTISKAGKRQIKLTEHNMITFTGSTQDREYSGRLPTRFFVRCPVLEGVKVPPVPMPPGTLMELPEGDQIAPEGTPPIVMPARLRRDAFWVEAIYTIEVLLTLEELATGEVAFGLEAPALSRVMHQSRRDAARYFDCLLEDEFLVGLGSYSTKEVAAGSEIPVGADGRGPSL